MSLRLRPRYSLLTLLVLTALVAGGVKLWYGPHHVVEWVDQPGRILEREFTFTRNLRGERIIHGTCIERIYQPDESTLYVVHIQYYQHGATMPWLFVLSEQDTIESSLAALAKFGMTSEEQEACKADIEQEKNRLVALGLNYVGSMFVIETVGGRDWIWTHP